MITTMPGATFIEGEQVDLKTVEKEDMDLLHRGQNHPSIARFMTAMPYNRPKVEEYFKEITQGDNLHLLVVPREGEFEGEAIGHVFINPLQKEVDRGILGIWLLPKAQRRAFAKDAMAHLIDYAFESIGLRRLSVQTNEKNKVIQRYCERAGFTHEGTLREREFLEGEYRDVYVYGLLASEWDGVSQLLG